MVSSQGNAHARPQVLTAAVLTEKRGTWKTGHYGTSSLRRSWGNSQEGGSARTAPAGEKSRGPHVFESGARL